MVSFETLASMQAKVQRLVSEASDLYSVPPDDAFWSAYLRSGREVFTYSEHALWDEMALPYFANASEPNRRFLDISPLAQRPDAHIGRRVRRRAGARRASERPCARASERPCARASKRPYARASKCPCARVASFANVREPRRTPIPAP